MGFDIEGNDFSNLILFNPSTTLIIQIQTVMNNQLHLPSSINPQIQFSTPLSPVHFLTDRKSQYVSQLREQKNKLEMHVQVLKEHISNKRKHKEVIHQEMKKQKQKIEFWKSNFERVERQYGEKAEKVQTLKRIWEQKRTEKMKSDLEEFEGEDCSKKEKQKIILKPCSGKKQKNQANYSFQRIKSIVLKNRQVKRGQTLSLTHLHQYH